MTDTTSTTTTASPETRTETPTTTQPTILANSPEARTETGEIIDQTKTPVTEPELTPPSADGAPESYADFTAAEGTKLDAELIKAALPIFKESNLSQASAQKLVDFYTKHATNQAALAIEAVNTMRQSWRESVRTDPVIGAKLTAVQADIGKALASLGDAKLVGEFRDAMNLTGAGDHPALIKVLHKFADAVNEGTHVSGAGPSPLGQVPNGKVTRPSAAQSMYPTLPS